MCARGCGRARTAHTRGGSEGTRLDLPDVRQPQSCHLGGAASPGHSSPCREKFATVAQTGQPLPPTRTGAGTPAARRGGSQPSAAVPSAPPPRLWQPRSSPGVFGSRQVPRALKSRLRHKRAFLHRHPRRPRAALALPCCGQPLCRSRAPTARGACGAVPPPRATRGAHVRAAGQPEGILRFRSERSKGLAGPKSGSESRWRFAK